VSAADSTAESAAAARLALDHGGQRLARGMLEQRERDGAADERRHDERGRPDPAPVLAAPVMRGGGDLGDHRILVWVQRAPMGADGIGAGCGDRSGPAQAPLGPPGNRSR
jgi:hypothetical protein